MSMSKQSRRPRPHTFTPDVSVEPNHRGERPCSVCGMPAGNKKVHREPMPDDSFRILGESRLDSGAPTSSRPTSSTSTR